MSDLWTTRLLPALSHNCDNAGNCKTWFPVLLNFIRESKWGKRLDQPSTFFPSAEEREVWSSLSHGCDVWIHVCAKKNLSTSNMCTRVRALHTHTDFICSWCRNTWALVSLIIQYTLKKKSKKMNEKKLKKEKLIFDALWWKEFEKNIIVILGREYLGLYTHILILHCFYSYSS